ncbi:hypothetical protein [Methanofollis fontis]|uniref:DUF8173 domain-containing protein n=1 Tax=Methanofollis fontis TaxID=2052832 RepID=A0A483CTJ8_9EURY|nr:hypothetical protein [Methanofollis fontis]TAJ45704.1 hypothetical protein CUJ86_03030 [Methanofollis fontis]
MHRYTVIFLLVLLIVPQSSAIIFLSGSEVAITEPTDDDVIASGGRLVVDAPIESLIAAGGEILIRAPVRGDVILAGGSVEIDAAVGGKVVAAAGTIGIDAPIGRNLLCTGDAVTIGANSSIDRDAHIAARTVSNAGTIGGVLSVAGESFTNTGTAGTVDFQQKQREKGLLPGVAAVLITIGFLLLGLALIRFLPLPFEQVVGTLAESPLLNTLIGLVVIIGGAVILLILAITIIGIPFAAVAGILLLLSALLAGLFVSAWIGDLIAGRVSPTMGPYGRFFIGFVILALLMFVPVLGFLVRAVSVCLGTGAIVRTAGSALEGQMEG